MKKIINKNSIFTFILGMIVASVGAYGANKYQSNAIEYSPTDASWEVSNVNEAINSLYSNVTELENIKSIGDATATQILSGKKAVVKGNTITGTMTNRGAWTNTPTSSGKVTIPAGYHNGSGYVDTTSVYNAGYNEGGKITKLENVPLSTVSNTNGGTYYYQTATINISNLYSDYKNISIDNIIVEHVKEAMRYDSSFLYFDKSYNPQTGIITLVCKNNPTGDYGFYQGNTTNNTFNIYIY